MNQTTSIRKIRDQIKRLNGISDTELKSRGLDLKYEAMSGRPIRRLIVDAFALVAESSRRHLGIVHHDVQLLCGIEMSRGRIAEMKTGEGKTLTAGLLAYVGSLFGRGMHVVTFNDYLAMRDRDILAPVYSGLGLTSGVIYDGLPRDERSKEYQCDITYGSAKEFGFDFLRDRMALRDTGSDRSGVMRGTFFALVDEADSILIDEARTPLIIGIQDAAKQKVNQECSMWAAHHAASMVEGKHFHCDPKDRSVKILSDGQRFIRTLPEIKSVGQLSYREIFDYMTNAIVARRDYHLDKQYAIDDGKIVIIDELTGRPAPDRQWQRGIHQAIEAKEGLSVSPVNQQAATITIQTLFGKYEHICGMTGTIYSSRKEIRKIYSKRVVRIPTHRPVIRKQYPTRVFATNAEKYASIVQEIQTCVQQGRSVLIGTRTVNASEMLSAALHEKNVAHSLLNARYLEKEAEIVEAAGQPGRVTVATNMAGRGTDIKLHPSVRDAGGLHVILTELHESSRIDWQLIGRGSRQGDPGSFRIYVSFDDEILKLGFGDRKADRLRNKFQHTKFPANSRRIKYFLSAQAKSERKHLTDRLMLSRREKDRQKSLLEAGIDPYLNTVDE
ncbi:MAG TPA: preprotein translocase subunit SecA [Planctomycetaceae bacterium]|nr:preprotein translocase subunit SecA [Planctomycetaceae bacterium]